MRKFIFIFLLNMTGALIVSAGEPLLFRASGSETPYAAYKPSSFSTNDEIVIVHWNTDEGRKRLAQSACNADFYQLAHTFQPQINTLYCGMASSVIVLNAIRQPAGTVPSQTELEIRRPKVWGGGKGPFYAYSQITFLNELTDRVKKQKVIELQNINWFNTRKAEVFDPGLMLHQLKAILEVYQLNVDMFYAEEKPEAGVQAFRDQLKTVLADEENFIIANFKGKTYGATTGGHISPLAAYDEESDSLMLLDVAGHKNPWYWVPVTHFYKAMHTLDGETYRGWLVISEGLN